MAAVTASACVLDTHNNPKKGMMGRSASHADLLSLQKTLQQMSLQSAETAVCAENIEELALLTRKASFRSAIMSSGQAVTAISLALSSHDAHVQRWAAAAVQNLAIDLESVSKLSGCLPGLLKLLQASDDSEALLAAAAGALSNLCFSEEICQAATAAPGCVQRLVQLLTHNSCVVREAAASVLGKLAWEPELCEPIADAGAIEPLATLLSSELSDDGGRQVAAAAIENLTYDNTTIRKSVVDAGGVPLLVSLLESDLEAAQKSAAGALHNLALARANCVHIAAAGGIEPLVELLETSSSEAVQAVAGGTLGKLALEPANRAEIVEAREKLLESSSSGGGSDSGSN